ncbi:MAG TPA: hypothetical protein VHN59_17795 [Chitinophagaceae bacterium]|nr:hypothetical protein [Chitinophagaceae bacterium]
MIALISKLATTVITISHGLDSYHRIEGYLRDKFEMPTSAIVPEWIKI